MGQTAGIVQDPGIPTGYQPSLTSFQSPLQKEISSSAILKDENGLWPSDQKASFKSDRNFDAFLPSKLPSFPVDDLPPGRNFHDIPAPPNPLASHNSHHSYNSGRASEVRHGVQERILPTHQSFTTDVESSYAPSRNIVGARPTAIDRREDSFMSDLSYAPSAAGSRPYPSAAPPHSSSASNMSARGVDDSNLFRQGTKGCALDVASAGLRANWEEGTIIEAFSATTNRWYPAQITEVQPRDDHEVLTVLFYVNDEPKQKSVYRNDPQLASLGANTVGELPPGFETRASQSRPGQLVYLDATTGTKYASIDLAWRLHFERMQQRPSDGLQTVACVQGPARSVPNRSAWEQQVPTPSKALTLAELNAMGTAEIPPLKEPSKVDGKVALPSFGDGFDNQAAYLGFVGNIAVVAEDGAEGFTPLTGGYPSIKASAPRRPIKIRNVSPALQTWQEDPFSEWRR